MNYTPPPPPPDISSPLFDVLGEKLAAEKLALKRIQNKRNAQYEPKKPTRNQGMNGPLGEVFL